MLTPLIRTIYPLTHSFCSRYDKLLYLKDRLFSSDKALSNLPILSLFLCYFFHLFQYLFLPPPPPLTHAIEHRAAPCIPSINLPTAHPHHTRNTYRPFFSDQRQRKPGANKETRYLSSCHLFARIGDVTANC
ncbi:hypothetical protein VTO42DRAFT_4197 [Malbranchea cinnamomea]